MITALVCTYNRAPTLRRMLTSFYAQDCLDLPHELILVDNNSTDETQAVAAEFAHQPGFRCIVETKQGLSPARNRGIAESTGDIIACLDDDVLLDPQWLAKLQACYDETGAQVVGGRSYLVIEGDPPPWFGPDFRRYLSEVDLGDDRCDAGDGSRLFGLNVSFNKDALLHNGGFDARLGRTGGQLLCGEERTLIARIHAAQGKILYEPAARVGHIIDANRLNMAYFLRLCAGTGASHALSDQPAAWPVRLRRLLDTLAKFFVYLAAMPAAWLAGPNRYPYRALRCRFERMRTLLPLRWDALWHGVLLQRRTPPGA